MGGLATQIPATALQAGLVSSQPLAPHILSQPADSAVMQTNCERSSFWLWLETGVISFDRADELLIKCLSESGICRKTNVC